MSKRIVLLLSFVVGFMWAAAKQISVSQAEVIAAKYVKLSMVAKSKKSNALKLQSREAGDCAEYYAFNIGSGDGYVIVSGDDTMTELVGYSDSGSIDMDNLPDNMRSWLDSYAAYVRHVRQYGNASKKIVKKGEPVVDSFMKVYWNQNEPFNDLCPVWNTSTGERCPAGCVATAMAQVMKYHEWPDVGVGSNSYSSLYGTLESDFSAHRYDYANMKSEYTSYYDYESDRYIGEWTETEAAAVARLTYDCAVAVNMAFSSTESGANTPNLLKALNTNFKYVAKYIDRGEKTTAEFHEIIKKEMDNRRPLLFCGTGMGGGHEFVIDGYDSNGYLHVNWGWSGMSDGFFDMNYMDPANVGIGGGSGGYYDGQGIMLMSPNRDGAIPSREHLQLSYYAGKSGGIHTSDTKIAKTGDLDLSLMYVCNWNMETWHGDLAIGLFDTEEKLLSVSKEPINGFELESGKFVTSWLYSENFSPDFSNLADGRYYLYGVSKETGDGKDYDWVKFSSPSRIVVDVEGDYVTVVNEDGKIVGNKPVECPEHSRLGFEAEFKVSLHSTYRYPIRGWYYWSIKRTSDGSEVYNGSDDAIIYDNSDYETVVKVYLYESNFSMNEEYVFSIDKIQIGSETIAVEDCSGTFVIDGVRLQQALRFNDNGDGKQGLSLDVDKFRKTEPQTVWANCLANGGTENWNGLFATGLYDDGGNLLSVTKEPYIMEDFDRGNELGLWDFQYLTPEMDAIGDGKYHVCMISKEMYGGEYYDDWLKVEGDDGVMVEVKDDWVYVGGYGGVDGIGADTAVEYIDVYNMNGLRVARLESLSQLTSSGLPSGCYVVSIVTGSDVVRRKIIL